MIVVYMDLCQYFVLLFKLGWLLFCFMFGDYEITNAKFDNNEI